MSTLEMKQELVMLIQVEENLSVLEAIHELLTHKEEEVDPLLQEKMISRALKAEEDIKAGRVYSSEEFKSKVNEHIAKYK